ncbi:MAG TPA: hypothetical protein VFQ58_07670, partial [Flavisolibacter sp.]|nr:hypothetical protein [Flavisolibacter sp.]
MKKIILAFCLLFIALESFSQTYPDSQADGKYITVNGAKLWVVTFGHGDPLIFIPGGPGGTHI